MLTLVVILLVCLTVFIISFIAPHKGSKIQNKTSDHYFKIRNYLRHKPKIARLLLIPPSLFSHKTVRKTAYLGKKARHKTPKN
jgi:hypothetical protein